MFSLVYQEETGTLEKFKENLKIFHKNFFTTNNKKQTNFLKKIIIFIAINIEEKWKLFLIKLCVHNKQNILD